jgi:saccharopine dehydrogenase (NADP+, L-glutamate forming)
MKRILVIGAGRSARILIDYLLDNSSVHNWNVTVADYSLDLAKNSINNSENGSAILFDVNDEKQRQLEISKSDIVISMLPASMHVDVAKDCINFKKDLVTASYVSEEMNNLNKKAEDADVLLLNEIGLDPGIDHMSAMQVINDIKQQGGILTSFKSFCGGLVHPEYDDNPWNYKFTWNPRNVVLAGQGVAQYIENGQYKYIPYNNLFERLENIQILDLGDFEGYANRDSLSYRKLYGLENIQTLIRGTLRKKGYCAAWKIFVDLGLTDDTYQIKNSQEISNRDFINMFLPYHENLLVEDKFCEMFKLSKNSDVFKKFEWLGIFSNDKQNIKHATPAQLLQSILEGKWRLSNDDKDMIVMQHQFHYILNGEKFKHTSSLVVYGETNVRTSMAKTVGLPVAIATKLILENKIKSKGVSIPTKSEIYEPILKELSQNGIDFVEELIKVN